MDSSELIKKVRKIEIKTKGLTNQVFAGSYHSAFKGRGMSFSEVRNYNYGDDVRSIDWNVTARYDEPFIKVYEEERELTVMLLIDISKSSFFGTQNQFKNEYITEIAAILAFSAIRNNDKVGVIFYSNKIEKYIPAKKGKSHILRIIRELLDLKPSESGTNLALALKYFNNNMKRSSIAFILSDFIDKPENYHDGLSVAKKRHDVIGLHVYDQREKILSDSGLIQFVDSESGKSIWIDTSDKKIREEYQKHFEENLESTRKAFYKKGADLLSISTSDNYTIALKQMFNRRIQKK